MYKLFKIWIQRLLTARCNHTVSVYPTQKKKADMNRVKCSQLLNSLILK